MNLETFHLSLKPLQETQAQSWFHLSQDSGLTSFQISNYKMLSHTESLEWIRQKQNYLDRNEIGTIGVFLKSKEQLIGVCALKYLGEEKDSDVEVMYRLAREYWGNGYATEIGRALINYAKSTL
jgi:ribosomal-protein-alanine N-acetyltransferase